MNENIAFSPIEAEKLNKKVRDTLAEHLFVLCNYNPDSIMVFSEDARFMQASLNMYKFLVDAGICNNLRSIGKKYSINYDYVRLENIVKNINSIRSTLGHNLDERNGTEEDKEAVEQWFLKVVGKKQLTNAEEYKKVVEEIEKYGEESVAILTDFIEAVGKSGKKNEIIEEWENLIINFYKRSNSKKIFEGQLILAYQSRLGNARNSSKVNVASWVKRMFFYKEQSQISNLQEIMRKSSFSSSVLKNIGEKIDENEKIINEKKDKWDLIVREALKQCQGVKPTKIAEVVKIKDIELEKYDLIIVPYECEEEYTLKNLLKNREVSPKKVLYIIGPEGGFDSEEIEYLKSKGANIVTLGKRILRAETASIVVGGILINEF